MIVKKRLIEVILVFVLLILIALAINEARYINKVEFLSPVIFNTAPKLRNDVYGKGHFGARRNGGRKHAGVDFLAEVGTDVVAVRSGWVINAEFHRGLGNYVEIQHSKNLITIYGHLSQILVKKGQRVCQGQIIGKVGKTGNANYKAMLPHLHFEIRVNKRPIDPMEHLTDCNVQNE
ncbi:MAG: M23 family metallopeptidase [Candidatus Omnitrophica bacterium]|nr:M23 family metallopeptidase [Candidatus Omnitrophota bacterium]